MTPTDIKYELEKAGFTQADVARMCKVTHRQTVNAVIRGTGRSRRIEETIAGLLHKPLADVWPHWYGPDAKRRRRRMNTADLYARVQALEAQLAAAKAA